MMMSPECYYESDLKGKTKEQIMTAIRGLKQELGRLKNRMEHPDYVIEGYPSDDTQLHWTRKYLEKAKEAYAEAGGRYPQSKAEKQASDFNANLDAINIITFNIFAYLGGYRTYVIDLTGELKAYIKLWKKNRPLPLWNDDNEESFSKDTFLAALRKIHIGEWRRRYSTMRFGTIIRDGAQWEMKFEYNNGHKPVKYDGSNSYPYNFDNFLSLLGVNYLEVDEDE